MYAWYIFLTFFQEIQQKYLINIIASSTKIDVFLPWNHIMIKIILRLDRLQILS